MPCERTFRNGKPDGWLCTSGSSPKSQPAFCSVRGCGSEATKLCDHPVDGGTCDRNLCDFHAATVRDVRHLEHVARGGGFYLEPDTFDLCPKHSRFAAIDGVRS